MDARVCAGGARIGERRLVLNDFTCYAREHGTTEYEVLLRTLQGTEKEYDG